MKNDVRVIITARAVIFNEQNEVLLVKNKDSELWFTPGGWIDGFETLEEACVREVFEELGIKVKVVKPLKVDYYKLTAEENKKWKENVNKIEHYFLCKVKEGAVQNSLSFENLWEDKDEGNTHLVRFFSKEELLKEKFAPSWVMDLFSKE